MYKLTSFLFFISILSSCDESANSKTPEMERDAKNTVLEYLAKNQLPVEKLRAHKSLAKPTPDFSFLYTGGGRCIEFIINCNGKSCKKLEKYPYDEHGEQCP
jgi:hypothetical protein